MEGLARREDLQDLRDTPQSHEERSRSIDERFKEMEEKMEATLHGSPRRAPPRTSGASRGSTSGRCITSSGEWQPRLVHLSGFAPKGCPPSQKLWKAQVAELPPTCEGH